MALVKECKDCKYWFMSETNGGFGRCHRYAPRPWVCSSKADEDEWEEFRYAKWPDTNAENWCGEFESKEPADAAVKEALEMD